MRVAVLGAGAWGTALAVHAVRTGHAVSLWARDPALAEALARDRAHPRRLPGMRLPEVIEISTNLAEASEGAECVVLATPSEGVATLIASLPEIRGESVVLSAVKGFELATGRRVSEIARELRPAAAFAVLSGPTFADGLIRGDPTAAVVASERDEAARRIQEAFSGSNLRLYRSADVVGVELFGGLKNVVAIASGIVAGMGYGPNTTAALVTRGLAEIARLVRARGGEERTLWGLAGVGDLVLTCTGPQSRNRRFGEWIGRGLAPAQAQARVAEVVEGIRASLAAARLAEDSRIEMPIAAAVRQIVHEGLSPRAAVETLMSRELRAE